MRLPTGETGRRIFKRLRATSDLKAPDYRPATERIEENLKYLKRLAANSNVVWVGPRLEPYVSMRTLVKKGGTVPLRCRTDNKKCSFKSMMRLRKGSRHRLFGMCH